jgi:hypothetical protein
MQVETEVGIQILDREKAKLKMASISFIFPTFLHAFSNAIQSHQIVQVTEQSSFKFHQGQNKT